MTLSRVGFVAVPPGGKPGFDHADVYRAGRRMYVAHTGADRVDVLDCRTHTFLRSLSHLPGVAGVLIDEEHDLLFTSDRDAARVSVFRCSDEQLLGRVAVGPHPNGLADDRKRRHGLWLDRGRLFCAADAGVLVALDRDGQVVASLPLPAVPDVVMHDPDLQRLYVAIGEPGLVCSFESERLEARETVATEQGAHTIGWDPDGRSLYVFCPASAGAMVFEDNT